MATSYFRTGTTTPAAEGPQLAVTGQTPSAQRKLHVFPELYFIRPELSPFLHLSRAGIFNRIQVGDPWFRQFEQPEHDYVIQVTESILPTETTVTLAAGDGAQVKPGDRIMPLDGSGQVALVLTVVTDALTVQWFLGSGAVATTTGIVTVATNTYFQLLGNTSKEGSTLPQIVQPLVNSRDNYTETMRHPFGGTRHRLTADMWTGRGMDHLAKIEWMTAKKAIEWKFKWQTPNEWNDGSDNVYRTTGGLFYWITQQSGIENDYSGSTFSKTTFIDDLITLFEHGSETRIMFASPKMLSIIDNFKDAKLQMGPSEMIYNMKVQWFETSQGQVMMVRDLSLTQPNSYGAGTMNAMSFLIDPEYIDYVTYQGNDIHVELDKQQPDYDGQINEYIGDVGIRVNYSQAHMVQHNIVTTA